MEVPMEMAKQPIDNEKIIFPEFEKYEIYEGKAKIEKNKGALINAFRYIGNGLGSLGQYLGEKYQEYDIGTKIKDGGSATLKGLSVAGNYIYQISKPVVNYASNKANEGVEYLYKKMNDNINKKDETKSDSNIKEENNEMKISFNLLSNEDGDKGKNINEIENNNINNMNNVDYPSLSQINRQNDGDINNSAAPIINNK